MLVDIAKSLPAVAVGTLELFHVPVATWIQLLTLIYVFGLALQMTYKGWCWLTARIKRHGTAA